MNRVRVYERSPGSPLWIKWSDENNEPVRRSLKKINGRPVYDYDHAERVADRVSLLIKEARELSTDLQEVLGLDERHTLEELCDEYWEVHTSEKDNEGWSDKHQTDQERYRDFWLEKLGRETYVRDVTGATVEKAANRTSAERGWSPATKRHYLTFIQVRVQLGEDPPPVDYGPGDPAPGRTAGPRSG